MELIREVREEFRKYYLMKGPKRVRNLRMREWAYIPFSLEESGIGMIRHLGFKSMKELRLYFIQNLPRHLYYSTAYYEDPKAAEMEEKGWRGADLVFDIDADHLPGIEGKNYFQILEIAKNEIKRLIEEFLISDLGFSESSMEISFSGGRGYHVKVFAESILKLDGNARKEIGDYVRGVGGDPKEIQFLISMGASFGWPGRIARAAKMLEEMSKEEIISFFSNRGVEIDDGILRGIKRGSVFKKRSKLGERVIEALVEALRVEVDPQVTGDMKRLIRAPGSLHGKTGLVVTSLSLEELEDFDPLSDAVALSNRPVRIRYKEGVEEWRISLAKGVKIGDFKVNVRPGEEEEIPLYVAVPLYFMFGLIEEC